MAFPDSRPGPMLAKIGAWLQVAQIVGNVVALGILNKTLGEAKFNATDIQASMAQINGITTTMNGSTSYLVGGFAISFIGLILVIIAATVYHYRTAWFFWFLCLYGGLMMISPLLPFGLFFVIYALMKKDEFKFNSAPPTQAVI